MQLSSTATDADCKAAEARVWLAQAVAPGDRVMAAVVQTLL
jgi:hypothetical protein